MEELRLVAGACRHITQGACLFSFPPSMTVDVFLSKLDLVLSPEAVDHPDVVHSGLLHLPVHVSLHVLGPLLAFVHLSLGCGGSIDEITNSASPCLLNDRGDREAPHTFEGAVVHLGHVGRHNLVPRTVCVIQKGPFLQFRSVAINPLGETYGTMGLLSLQL